MSLMFADRFSRKCVIYLRGNIYYKENPDRWKQYTRTALPAKLFSLGDIEWFQPSGLIHCSTGPAITRINGDMLFSLNGHKVTIMEVMMS